MEQMEILGTVVALWGKTSISIIPQINFTYTLITGLLFPLETLEYTPQCT